MTRPSDGNARAVAEARRIASFYRRAGYSDACAAPEYCIDELGSDGFYTFTVSVFVGKNNPEAMSPLWKRLSKKLGFEA
jgi:hypothetical protein